MIAVMDEFLGGGIAVSGPGSLLTAGVAMVTIPAEASAAFSALVAVSHAVAQVERIALTAIVRRKSPSRVVPLLERHAALVKAQSTLARTVAVILHDLGGVFPSVTQA